MQREIERFKWRKKMYDEQKCDEGTEAENGLLLSIARVRAKRIFDYFALILMTKLS